MKVRESEQLLCPTLIWSIADLTCDGFQLPFFSPISMTVTIADSNSFNWRKCPTMTGK